jgi:hypothetical protein
VSGGILQPGNALYGAAAAQWAYQQSQQNPAGLARTNVSIAQTSSEAQYHADTFAYAAQDIKNFGGQNGVLTKAQMETAFGGKETGDKMFTALDTDKDGKINTAEIQAYVELQDDPTIVKGMNPAFDKYLDEVQQSQKQLDPTLPDMKRDGVATYAERTAADGLILNSPNTASIALKQLRERDFANGSGNNDDSTQSPFIK